MISILYHCSTLRWLLNDLPCHQAQPPPSLNSTSSVTTSIRLLCCRTSAPSSVSVTLERLRNKCMFNSAVCSQPASQPKARGPQSLRASRESSPTGRHGRAVSRGQGGKTTLALVRNPDRPQQVIHSQHQHPSYSFIAKSTKLLSKD